MRREHQNRDVATNTEVCKDMPEEMSENEKRR